MSYNLGHVVGADGKGIVSIEKTGTSGLVDTYTITYTDDTTSTFEVTNGRDGSGGSDIVTAWETVLSDEKIPSEKLTKNTIDTKANATHTHGNIDNTGILKISGTAQTSKNVVTDGTGKITVEAKPDLTNYIQKSSTTGLLKNDGAVMTSGTGSTNYSAGNHTHSGYVSATKVTSWSSTVSDSNVPSEKLVKDTIDTKVDKVTGKGLSTEDYTSSEKSKLAGIETGANNYTHPSSKQCSYSPDLSNYVPKSDIVDNLTTNDNTKVLSAKQGKALKDLIGDAINYINL